MNKFREEKQMTAARRVHKPRDWTVEAYRGKLYIFTILLIDFSRHLLMT